MKPLRPPDTFHLQAAQGWLELGNHKEAHGELERITPQFLEHPDVLRVRCRIFSAAKKWEAVRELSASLAKLMPNDPLGWLEGSEALHQLNQTPKAREVLLQIVNKFPADAIIHYNLARYETRLWNLQPAGDHLSQAFKISEDLKLKAWEDPDLRPLWKEHGITRDGDVLAKPLDLAAKPKPNPMVIFVLALLFWAIAAGGLAWKAGTQTLAGFSDAGLSAAGVLFGIGLFLFLTMGLAIIPMLSKREKLAADNLLSPVLRFVIMLVIAGVIGAALSLCCRL